MAFDFPASPTNGQTFTPSGGPTYAWNGTVWNQVSGNPATLTAQARNRVVNPAMQISQELGVAGTNTNLAYVVDQWQAQASGITFGAIKTNATAHQISIATTAGKALAAGDLMGFVQSIEGIRVWDFFYGSASAQPAVLRFDVYCPVTGTFGAAIRNVPVNRSFVASFTVPTASVWTTITIPIPGDTAGTWAVDTSAGMTVAITFACGTTYTTATTGWQAGNFLGPTGMTNGAATTSNTFYLRNVGLYLDPDNTGVAPPWVMPDEAEELRACMRYWQSLTGDGFLFSGNVTSSGSYFAGAVLDIPMRNTPAISGTNASSQSFPATVGTFTGTSKAVRETRVANVTSGGWFLTNVTLNARM